MYRLYNSLYGALEVARVAFVRGQLGTKQDIASEEKLIFDAQRPLHVVVLSVPLSYIHSWYEMMCWCSWRNGK